jgi:hypothetical protein
MICVKGFVAAVGQGGRAVGPRTDVISQLAELKAASLNSPPSRVKRKGRWLERMGMNIGSMMRSEVIGW